MKLYPSLIRTYSPVISHISSPSTQYHESLYFDFDGGWIYFMNEFAVGRIPMIVEKEDGETHPNFFINAESLMYLSRFYEELDLHGCVLYNGEEKFNFQHFIEDFEPPLFEEFGDESIQIDSLSSLQETLVDSLSYIGSDQNSELNGVFIRDGKVITSDLYRLFEGKVDLQVPDTNLPFLLSRILSIVDSGSGLELEKERSRTHIRLNGECELYVGDAELNIVDTTDPQFVSKYNHDSYIVVDRSLFENTLRFLEPFTRNLPDQRVLLHVENGELQIQVRDRNDINKRIAIEENEGIDDGTEFWVSAEYAKTISSHIHDEKLKIQIDPEQPGINYVGNTNADRHIVYSKLKDAE